MSRAQRARLRNGPGGHRVEAGEHTLQVRAVSRLAQDQVSGLREAVSQQDHLNHRAAARHSTTSSARARRVGGIVRWRALAALTLMINSNTVGCSIGRSAGLAPRAMRST